MRIPGPPLSPLPAAGSELLCSVLLLLDRVIGEPTFESEAGVVDQQCHRVLVGFKTGHHSSGAFIRDQVSSEHLGPNGIGGGDLLGALFQAAAVFADEDDVIAAGGQLLGEPGALA